MKVVRKVFRVSAFNKPLERTVRVYGTGRWDFIFRLIRNKFVIPRYDE